LLEQCLQVVLEIPVVGQSRFGGVVQTHLDVGECHLELAGKPRQCAQPTNCVFLGSLDLAQAQQRLTKLGGEECWQRAPLGRFDSNRVDTGRFSIPAHAIEQYSFTNPTQSHQHGTPGRASDLGALKCDVQCAPQLVTSREFWRRRAGAGSKRVADGIHGDHFILIF